MTIKPLSFHPPHPLSIYDQGAVTHTHNDTVLLSMVAACGRWRARPQGLVIIWHVHVRSQPIGETKQKTFHGRQNHIIINGARWCDTNTTHNQTHEKHSCCCEQRTLWQANGTTIAHLSFLFFHTTSFSAPMQQIRIKGERESIPPPLSKGKNAWQLAARKRGQLLMRRVTIEP